MSFLYHTHSFRRSQHHTDYVCLYTTNGRGLKMEPCGAPDAIIRKTDSCQFDNLTS